VIEGENVADTVNNYDGPVFNAEVSGAQLAWNATNVVQNQQLNTSTVAPGFEELAAVVADVLRKLPQIGLSQEDREDAEVVAGEVLAEITSPEPEKGKVRRALAMLRNLLAPVATGAVAGVAAGTQEWAQAAITGLGS
jgi:hypothetical protein